MTSGNESKKNKHLGSQTLWDWMSIVLVVFFPVAYLYLRNLTLVNLREVLLTFLLFFLMAIAIVIVARFISGNISKATFIASVSMLMFMLFQPAEKILVKLLPFIYYWHMVYILLTLLVLITIFVSKKISSDFIQQLNKIVAAVFGILIIINVIMAVPNIIKEWRKDEVSKTEVVVEENRITNSENVYVLIFDEYSGLDALQRYTGYDNSPFYKQLEGLGFNISQHSRNYTTNSNIEITNLLNLTLALTNENYTLTTKNELLEEPALFSLYKQKGYFVNVINDQSMIPGDAKGVDRMVVGQSNLAKAESFQIVMLKHSIIYPYLISKEGDRAQEIESLFEEIKKSSDLQDQKLLTVGYFMFPHLPWVLDENGNQTSASERDNWKNPNAYLGQLKYVSKRMLEVSEEIVQKDPGAIIVLLSDHAYRLPAHLERLYNEKIDDPALEYDYQRNILNAVYFKGQTLDINGLSGVNTLIEVINSQFSMDLPSVERGK